MSPLKEQINVAVEQAAMQAIRDGDYRRYIGKNAAALEQMLSLRLSDANVLLTNSGTSAVEIALRATGVQPGDEVILSGYDYPGNFWVVEQLGCVPVLVDVEANSTQVDFECLQSARSEKTKACIVSHLHGQFQKIVPLRSWADQNSIALIEDSCQALGASYSNDSVRLPVGTLGHFGIFSFSGTKVISAGRGGALVTSDGRLFQRAKIASGAGSGANGMSELTAAIVNAQLPFLETLNNQCQQFFSELQAQLSHDRLPHIFMQAASEFTPAYYQAGCISKDAQSQSRTIEECSKAGIVAGAGFPGFHRRSARRCRTVGSLENVARLVEQIVLIHHSSADKNITNPQQVAQAFQKSIAQ